MTSSELKFKQICTDKKLLSIKEIEAVLSKPHRYINFIQRVNNTRLVADIYRTDKIFSLKSTDIIIPYLEDSTLTASDLEQFLSLEGLDDHRHPDELIFGGIPQDQALSILNLPAYELVWQEPCHLYIYDGPPYAVDANEPFQSLTIDTLKLSDVDTVFHYYTFPDDGPNYIRDIIENELTFCLRDSDVPVSWVVQREDGSMGIMYTLEAYRRRGLGHHLTKFLVNAILAKGETPYLHIHLHNQASVKLAESLGFKKVDVINWFGIKKK